MSKDVSISHGQMDVMLQQNSTGQIFLPTPPPTRSICPCRPRAGSIRWATCSQPTDQQNIWDEIGDKVDEVDHAIHVLITAGISSPSLRAAAKLGVDINHAGHAEAQGWEER